MNNMAENTQNSPYVLRYANYGKRDVYKSKETYKRDLQKRPTKETYKRDLKTLSMHWAPTNRVAHQRHKVSSERRQNHCKYWKLTHCSHIRLFVESRPKFKMSDYLLIVTRNAHAKTQSISGSHTSRSWVEYRQRGVDTKIQQWMSGWRRTKNIYWNLHSVKMSHCSCSFIGIRNSHAQYNQSVKPVYYAALRTNKDEALHITGITLLMRGGNFWKKSETYLL